jgi:hypothetical protein
MFDDKITNLSLENIYLMHVIQIGLLSTRLYLDNKAAWQVNARNYTAAIDDLEALAAGDLVNDKKYQRRAKNLAEYAKLAIRKNKSKNSSNLVFKNDFDMEVSIGYARYKLGLIMRSLTENGKIRSRTVSAIDDLPPGKVVVDPYQNISASQMQKIFADLARAGQLPSGLVPDSMSQAISALVTQAASPSVSPGTLPEGQIFEYEDEDADADLVITPQYPDHIGDEE